LSSSSLQRMLKSSELVVNPIGILNLFPVTKSSNS
jgi:hypothetical protein